MKRISIASIIYGILLVIGGLVGYFLAGSIPSLVASSSFATLVFLSALGIQMKQKWAFPLLITCLFALFAFFGYRYYGTLKFMPPGMMAIITLAFLGYIYTQRNVEA